MAQRKTERLLNLTIALLNSRRYVTRQQLRAAIDGYDETNDAAFERQFERDKDELRALGVPITTGHNDPWFEDEPGYRIARADFELPPIEFSADELTALGVAATAWQQSLVSEVTISAIRKLRAGGAEPDAERLGALVPHIAAKEPAFEPLWSALAAHRRVRFDYRGESREVDPWQLFCRRGKWYLIGFDHRRDAARAFKLARFGGLPTLIGQPSAFTPPSADEIRAHVERLQPTTQAKTAHIAITEAGAPDLRRRGIPLVDDTVRAPAGYRLYAVPYGTDAELVDDVCAAGPDALLVRPDDLRAEVVRRLERAAR